MFSNDGNGGSKSGLASLRNVLRAYSAFDKDVQYCQGMGFFTAMFLIYMSEEEAFWQLIGVMQGQGFNPHLVVSYRPDAIIDLDELHIPKVPALLRLLCLEVNRKSPLQREIKRPGDSPDLEVPMQQRSTVESVDFSCLIWQKHTWPCTQ